MYEWNWRWLFLCFLLACCCCWFNCGNINSASSNSGSQHSLIAESDVCFAAPRSIKVNRKCINTIRQWPLERWQRIFHFFLFISLFLHFFFSFFYNFYKNALSFFWVLNKHVASVVSASCGSCFSMSWYNKLNCVSALWHIQKLL